MTPASPPTFPPSLTEPVDGDAITPDTLVLIEGDQGGWGCEGHVRRFVPAGEKPVPYDTMVTGWAGPQGHDRYLVQVEPAPELERHGMDRLHVVRATRVRPITAAESLARLFLRLTEHLPPAEVAAALEHATALHAALHANTTCPRSTP